MVVGPVTVIAVTKQCVLLVFPSLPDVEMHAVVAHHTQLKVSQHNDAAVICANLQSCNKQQYT